MLNIGKLSPGATEYYVGEVATTAEDYYSGRGERPAAGSDQSRSSSDCRARSIPSSSGACCAGRTRTPARISSPRKDPRRVPRNAAVMCPSAMSCPSSSTRCAPPRTSGSLVNTSGGTQTESAFTPLSCARTRDGSARPKQGRADPSTMRNNRDGQALNQLELRAVQRRRSRRYPLTSHRVHFWTHHGDVVNTRQGPRVRSRRTDFFAAGPTAGTLRTRLLMAMALYRRTLRRALSLVLSVALRGPELRVVNRPGKVGGSGVRQTRRDASTGLA